jgi:hypothetical protein
VVWLDLSAAAAAVSLCIIDESQRGDLVAALVNASRQSIKASMARQQQAKQALVAHHKAMLFAPVGAAPPQLAGALGVLASSRVLNVPTTKLECAKYRTVLLYFTGGATVSKWCHNAAEESLLLQPDITLYQVVANDQAYIVNVVALLDKPNLADSMAKFALYDKSTADGTPSSTSTAARAPRRIILTLYCCDAIEILARKVADCSVRRL